MFQYKIKIATQADIPKILDLRKIVIRDTYLLPDYGITKDLIEKSFLATDQTPERFVGYMKTLNMLLLN